jgi:hypothetical protein
MNLANIFLIATSIFSLIFGNEALASQIDRNVIDVEVTGMVPGFTQEQLGAFLAQKIREESPAPWRFAVGQKGIQLPNRIVWSFKTLREVWKGGTHSGFPSQTNSLTYLRAEVKFYLNDAYQMTLDMHPTISGNTDNHVLAEMVHDAVHSFFVENTPDMQ